MDDQNTSSEPAEETKVPESAPVPVEPDSDQPTGSDTANTPPIAPESPINDSRSTPVEDQNQGVNQPESSAPEEPISAPSEPEAPVSEPTPQPIQPSPVQSAPVLAP